MAPQDHGPSTQGQRCHLTLFSGHENAADDFLSPFTELEDANMRANKNANDIAFSFLELIGATKIEEKILFDASCFDLDLALRAACA